MKLRERLDEIGLQLSKLTDVLRFTQTEKHGFALDYRLRLQLFEVAKGLKELGYEYQAPAQLSLSSLIKREAVASAAGGGVDANDIVNRVHSCLANHPPASRQVKNASGANDTSEAVAWEYLETEINAYLHGPPLSNRE